MAKTIKQMAKLAIIENNVLPQAKCVRETWFEKGANKVLEEIESILDAPISYVVEIGWQGQLNDICGMIRQRINELKGM